MMQIVFRNTKLSFTKHWGVDKSASIIRHFCAVGHSVPDSVRKVIGLGIPTSSQEKNKGHYLNLDDFQEVYEDSMLIHHGEMMALILHGFVPSSEAPEHVRMLGDLFQYGGTMLRTCSPESRMALFGHRFCCGDLTMDMSTNLRPQLASWLKELDSLFPKELPFGTFRVGRSYFTTMAVTENYHSTPHTDRDLANSVICCTFCQIVVDQTL
ncbi:unnamed protein product [Sphagnum jensenii]|uniref:Uncharacterized protein n=1 Tax=Sphagnum jensenii TaxID=128206 RepID=A0ABP0VL89_9BRYO